MSLRIYSERHKPPDNVKVVRFNDAYFNRNSKIIDTEFVRFILHEIDKVSYLSEDTFIGRNEALGGLYKESLSTGTKTLLNIIQHTKECFDVLECGNNVLRIIPSIKEGCIYWGIPIVTYFGNGLCDIDYGDEHFFNFYDFLDFVTEEGNSCVES